MIDCPTCGHQEFVGTLFCNECGTRLVHGSPVPTVSIARDEILDEAAGTKPAAPRPDLESGAILALRVVPDGSVISLIGRDNFTLGRALEGQAIVPDINLDRHEAFDQGVSRLHAEVRIEDEGIRVIDLDSVNGTLVNGTQIAPQTPVPIKHGDIVQLGRLRLQLISRVNR